MQFADMNYTIWFVSYFILSDFEHCDYNKFRVYYSLVYSCGVNGLIFVINANVECCCNFHSYSLATLNIKQYYVYKSIITLFAFA